MLVSIVLNNHNYGRYLRTAIDSALVQTYANVEVIVVDDGSTDDSRAVIASYGDRITPILKPCGGQPSAANLGIRAAHGDVVFLLDSDDVLEPDIVERVASTFQADPDVAWVMFRLAVIDSLGRPTGVIKPDAHVPRRGGNLQASIVAFPFDMVRMATSGNAFSARVLRSMLPIPEDVYVPSGIDWYFCPAAGLFGRTVFLDVIGGGYRLHGSNLNWWERPSMRIDLPSIRRELRCMHTTAATIQRLARELSIATAEEVLSVAYVGSRLVSLKLDPDGHPIAQDSVGHCFRLGVRATLRRFDVRWPMKLLFLSWFALMSLAPRAWAGHLAELFFFPGRRGPLNRLLGKLHLPAAAPNVMPGPALATPVSGRTP